MHDHKGPNGHWHHSQDLENERRLTTLEINSGHQSKKIDDQASTISSLKKSFDKLQREWEVAISRFQLALAVVGALAMSGQIRNAGELVGAFLKALGKIQ